MSDLRLSPQWRLEQRATELYLFGGQDAIFTLDLENRHQSFFATLEHDQSFRAEELNKSDRLVLEQLLSAGVVHPVLDLEQERRALVKVTSKVEILPKNDSWELTEEDAFDILILVRTNGTYREFLEEQNYAGIDRPHLFIDLAFQHTISIGPLVFPGTTSCVACLQGRITTRWGDELPPPKPSSSVQFPGLTQEWLAVELQKIVQDQDYSLVNKTVEFDVQSRTIQVNKLHTVPVCGYCSRSTPLLNGRLSLFATEETQP